ESPAYLTLTVIFGEPAGDPGAAIAGRGISLLQRQDDPSQAFDVPPSLGVTAPSDIADLRRRVHDRIGLSDRVRGHQVFVLRRRSRRDGSHNQRIGPVELERPT